MISSLAELRKPFRKASLRHMPELDSDEKTLHIRCGNDIEKKLAIAGFVGDFLHFSDPYIHNEIPNTECVEEFIEIRATQTAEAYGLPVEQVETCLRDEYAGLQKASEYPRVVMWFEHDPNDQLILARLLAYFCHPENRPQKLQLICVSEVPGIRRFIGLEQLTPEVLGNLWEDRKDVSELQLELGRQAWTAITSNSPQDIINFVSKSQQQMPIMSRALQRFLQELPSATNGLSLSEELTLKILHDEGELNGQQLLREYNERYESLAFMDESSYWFLLDGLANAEQAAIRLIKSGDDPSWWHVSLTATGFALLHNYLDWLKLNNIVRWVGGILIDSSKQNNWRFERMTGSIVTMPS